MTQRRSVGVLLVCLIALQWGAPLRGGPGRGGEPPDPWTAGSQVLAPRALAPLFLGQSAAMCNLIPPAEKVYPSTLGSVLSPITAPGKTVEIRLNFQCDTSNGFDDVTPTNNVVTLTFEPPGGGSPTAVVVDAGDVTVDNIYTLKFEVPDTTDDLPPYGLAGPAHITVVRSGTTVADIKPLFQPTLTCDREAETVFHAFTVLPAPNVFQNLVSGATTKVLLTLDGDGNVLIPFNYLATLPQGIGAPVARLLLGSSTIEAFTGGGTAVNLPSGDFVRSFTLDGRPLPPLLRVTGGNQLFGTVDGDLGILRIARRSPDFKQCADGANDGKPCTQAADCPGGTCGQAECEDGSNPGTPCSDDSVCLGGGECGPALYDFTDRLYSSQGPIVVDKNVEGFTTTKGEPVPLKGLKSSREAVGFARDESIEGTDLNGDTDQVDRVVQLIDVQSGAGTNTNRAVTSVTVPGLSGFALETTGTLTAFLESEARQGGSIENADGDSFDNILRVYDSDGTDKSPAPAVSADPSPVVNGHSLAISGPLVFFRTREGDDTGRITERVSVNNAAVEGNGGSFGTSISANGRYVAFYSQATNLVTPDNGGFVDVFVYDRTNDTIERVSQDSLGVQANDNSGFPSISADGLYVAFRSAATNLVTPDNNGSADDIFVYDRLDHTIERVSQNSAAVQANNGSFFPSISADGRYVAFISQATNLVTPDDNGFTSDVFVYDRLTDTLERVSQNSAGVQANGFSQLPSISVDGRYIAFSSGATNLVAPDDNGGFEDVFVYDRITDTIERVSQNGAGVQANSNSEARNISADGRYVAFVSGATNLVTPDDNGGAEDVFVYDRTTDTIERVSQNGAGMQANGSSWEPSTSADGRYVAFWSFATNLVTPDTNLEADVFVYDRMTDTIERVSQHTLGAQGSFESRTPAMSADGRSVAFESDANNLVGGDMNGVTDIFVRGIGPGTSLNSDSDLSDTVLQVFDTSTMSLRLAARTAASVVAVAAQRAAVLIPEAEQGGDFNLDGDTTDETLRLYDGLTDTAEALPAVVDRIALSGTLLAFTTPENQNGSFPFPGGTDYNGDGDFADSVLGIWPVPMVSIPQGTVLAADAIGVTDLCFGGSNANAACESNADCPGGGTCKGNVVLITPEPSEGVGGTDFNADADIADRVLRTYRPASPTTYAATNLAVSAEDFVIGGNLVAFRTSEAAQGNRDLNGDGDTLDFVMQVYDMASNTVIPTGQAAILCTFPGCESFTPYKVKGDVVAFVTREPDQGNRDLDGDGDALDTVLQLFNVRSRKIRVFNLSCGAPDLSPFPEDYIDGSILSIQVKESEVGQDLNNDGDQDDCVIQICADVDHDGNCDDDDTCRETPNAAQADNDLDALGDTCDPAAYCSGFVPAPPPLAPGTAEDCQKAIGSVGRTYLRKRAAAIRTCLDKIATGKLSGDASALCRGNFLNGVAVAPGHAKTAEKLATAAEKAQETLAKKCSDSVLVQLDACAAALGSIEPCLLERYGTSAIGASELAYGMVGSIGDRQQRACQTAAGRASANYLHAVVKAQQGCLDKLNAGKLSGAAQPLCLGGLTTAGVVLPSHADTAEKITKAEVKLRAALAKKCPGSELASLQACGTTVSTAGDCLVCANWRRAVEALRSGYGPN